MASESVKKPFKAPTFMGTAVKQTSQENRYDRPHKDELAEAGRPTDGGGDGPRHAPSGSAGEDTAAPASQGKRWFVNTEPTKPEGPTKKRRKSRESSGKPPKPLSNEEYAEIFAAVFARYVGKEEEQHDADQKSDDYFDAVCEQEDDNNNKLHHKETGKTEAKDEEAEDDTEEKEEGNLRDEEHSDDEHAKKETDQEDLKQDDEQAESDTEDKEEGRERNLTEEEHSDDEDAKNETDQEDFQKHTEEPLAEDKADDDDDQERADSEGEPGPPADHNQLVSPVMFDHEDEHVPHVVRAQERQMENEASPDVSAESSPQADGDQAPTRVATPDHVPRIPKKSGSSGKENKHAPRHLEYRSAGAIREASNEQGDTPRRTRGIRRDAVSKADKQEKLKKKEKTVKEKRRSVSVKEKMQNREIEEDGIWVQCTSHSCLKWRYLSDMSDPAQVCHTWMCHMNSDTEYNECSAPEQDYEESEHVFTSFTEGSVVWARMPGYPWWPGMIEIDPDHEAYFEYDEEQQKATAYHVVFFDEKVSRAWIKEKSLKAFTGQDNEVSGPTKIKGTSYKKLITNAKCRAMTAINMSLKERVQEFGFCSRYSGKWAWADPDDDVLGDSQEEAGSRKAKRGGRAKKVTSAVDGVEDLGLSSMDVDEIMGHAESIIKTAEEVLDEFFSGSSNKDNDSQHSEFELDTKPRRSRPSKVSNGSGTPVKRRKIKKREASSDEKKPLKKRRVTTISPARSGEPASKRAKSFSLPAKKKLQDSLDEDDSQKGQNVEKEKRTTPKSTPKKVKPKDPVDKVIEKIRRKMKKAEERRILQEQTPNVQDTESGKDAEDSEGKSSKDLPKAEKVATDKLVSSEHDLENVKSSQKSDKSEVDQQASQMSASEKRNSQQNDTKDTPKPKVQKQKDTPEPKVQKQKPKFKTAFKAPVSNQKASSVSSENMKASSNKKSSGSKKSAKGLKADRSPTLNFLKKPKKSPKPNKEEKSMDLDSQSNSQSESISKHAREDPAVSEVVANDTKDKSDVNVKTEPKSECCEEQAKPVIGEMHITEDEDDDMTLEIKVEAPAEVKVKAEESADSDAFDFDDD